jgi:hypothetical protein
MSKIWRVDCITDSRYEYTNSDTIPTVCPVDDNHIVGTIKEIGIAETININDINNSVKIQNNVPGNFQYTTINFTVPSGTPGDVTIHDFSWPMTLLLWRTGFLSEITHIGDVVSTIISPDLIIGVLTEDANIGDTELSINPEVFLFPKFTNGIELKLDDTSKTEKPGRLIGIDSENSKITIESSLTQNFVSGTMLRLNICTVKDASVRHANVSIGIGTKGFSSIEIPANTIVRFEYKNNNGLEKEVYIEMEYNYQ